MSSSFTVSETATFTLTHAKHMAAKVATDLKRLQRLYGSPSDAEIAKYETEVIELLKAGYLGTLTVGFRRDGRWIEPTLRFTARDLAGGIAINDDPGRIKPGANIVGASFYNYLTYSLAWYRLTPLQQDAFQRAMPFYRTGAPVRGSMAISLPTAPIPPVAARSTAPA
jgi:Bacterial HORMA domain family 1